MAHYLDSVPFSGIIRIRDMMYGVKDPFRLDQGDVSFDAPETVKTAMRRRHRREPQPLRADDRRAAAARAARREAATRRTAFRSARPTRSWSRTAASTRCTSSARRCSSPATRSSCRIPSGRRATGNITAAHGVPVPCPLHERLGWRYDLDELESKITPRTRAIYINSPHNPTGGVLTRADIERIAAHRRRARPLADLGRGLRGCRLRRRGAREPGVAAGHVRADDLVLHVQQDVRDDRPAAGLRRGARMRRCASG